MEDKREGRKGRLLWIRGRNFMIKSSNIVGKCGKEVFGKVHRGS